MSHKYEQADNHKLNEACIPTNSWGQEVFIDGALVEHRLFDIKNKIAPCKPRIIGVTKYFGLDAVIKGYKAGLVDFGESRAVDAIKKIDSLPKEIRENAKFHFIGHLQSNKAEQVVEYFDYIHSVDSLKLAKVISETACRLNKKEKVLIQVNNAGEEQKFGYSKQQLELEIREIIKLSGLEVVGLMNLAPLGASEIELREIFRDLREYRDFLEREFSITLPELSMGMSNDYHIAVQEGATMIRVGRKLFS
jgi:pyridoxal phosphate enzyme (YggS family)